MNRRASLPRSFRPLTGAIWNDWNLSAPIFEHFYIFGPKDFNEDSKPELLYEYPREIVSTHHALVNFLFVDGLHRGSKEFSNISSMQFDFCSPNDKADEIILLGGSSAKDSFTYCLRFEAHPYNRPAIDDPSLNSLLSEYKDNYVLPTCYFAICFTSRHPFHSFLFPALYKILEIEAKTRTSSHNLYSFGKIQEGFSSEWTWPTNTVSLREKFIGALLSTNLPSFGEKYVIYSSDSVPFVWSTPIPDQISFQLALWSYRPLLAWMTTHQMVDIITALLMESSVTVIGSNIEDVVKTVVLLPQLISPFVWSCPVITILPPHMFAYLDSPMAIIAGTLANSRPPVYPDHLVIDLDAKDIQVPGKIKKLRLPGYQEIYGNLKLMLFSIEEESRNMIIETVFRYLRDALQESIGEMVHRSVVTDVSTSEFGVCRFSKDIFVDQFAPNSREFAKEITDTQLFSSYVDSVIDSKTEAYVDDIESNLMTLGQWSQTLKSHLSRCQIQGLRSPSDLD